MCQAYHGDFNCSDLLRGTCPRPWGFSLLGYDDAVVIESQTGGGAVTTRPVRPEYPDASSGCIEGPARLSLWVGPKPSWRSGCVRPLIRAGEAPALLRANGLCGPSNLNGDRRPTAPGNGLNMSTDAEAVVFEAACPGRLIRRFPWSSVMLAAEAHLLMLRPNHPNHQIPRIPVQTFPQLFSRQVIVLSPDSQASLLGYRKRSYRRSQFSSARSSKMCSPR